MKSDEKSPPAEAGGPFDRSIRFKLALTALLAGFLLAALLAAVLTALTALLPALIWIVRHWKRLLIAG